jgi:tetratricopeptide (TPR) repeat protein
LRLIDSIISEKKDIDYEFQILEFQILCNILLGKTRKAKIVAERCLDRSRKVDKAEWKFKFRVWLCKISVENYDFTVAEQIMSKLKATYSTSYSPEILIQYYLNTGYFALIKGSYENSQFIVSEFKKLLDTLDGNIADKARGHLYLVKTYIEIIRFDFKKSIEFAQISHEILLQYSNPMDASWPLHMMAVLLERQGNLNDAEKCWNKTIELRKENKGYIAQSYLGLAFIHRQRGYLDKAEVATQKAYQIVVNGDNYKLLADTYSYLGTIFREKGNYEEAIQSFLKCLEIKKKLDLGIFFASNLLTYANIIFTYDLWEYKEETKNYFNKMQEYIVTQGQRSEAVEGRNNQDNLMHGEDSRIYANFAEAVVLKNSSRMRDKSKALNILEELVFNPKTSEEFRMISTKYLCQLYLYEYENENDKEIMNDILTLLEKQSDYARKNNSILIQVELLIIHSKVSVVLGNFNEAM